MDKGEESKADFLEWLLKPRKGGYPFVTYRGAAVDAEVNLLIPFEEISKYFGVDRVTIRGEVWERNPSRSVSSSGH